MAVPLTAATSTGGAMQFEEFYRSQADRVYRALAGATEVAKQQTAQGVHDFREIAQTVDIS